MKANTTFSRIIKAVRRFFVGEAYTVAALLPGYGTFTCTITAPNRELALREAEAMADPGFILSCELAV